MFYRVLNNAGFNNYDTATRNMSKHINMRGQCGGLFITKRIDVYLDVTARSTNAWVWERRISTRLLLEIPVRAEWAIQENHSVISWTPTLTLRNTCAKTDVMDLVAKIVTIANSKSSETKVTYVEPRFHCETRKLRWDTWTNCFKMSKDFGTTRLRKMQIAMNSHNVHIN